MREIKFRAWAKEQKIMVYSDDFTNINPIKRLNAFFHWIQDLKPELMQYTGLKDKNGKEIYEGDVIVYDGDIDDPDSRYEIKWVDEIYGFQLSDDIPISDVEHLIVLGNIYENPELLK
jgi:uncharacterized phage protein (TIGR01671 family)